MLRKIQKFSFQLSLHRIWQVLAGVPTKRHNGVQQNQRLVWKHCPDKVGWHRDLFQSEHWGWHSLSACPNIWSDHKKVRVFKNAWFQKHWSYTSLKTCSVINLARRWRLLAKGQYCDLLNIILGYRRGQVGSKGLFHTGKLFLSVWDETSNNHKDIIAIAFVFMSLVYSIKQFWIKRKGTQRCSSQISKVYKTLRDLLQLQLCLHFQQYRKKFRQVQRRFVYFLYFAVINAWLLQPVHLLTYISRVPTNVAGMGWSKMIKDEAFICENV